jgi:DNA-directed RNA polymerase sigma subunit (sigma70/sigma32)
MQYCGTMKGIPMPKSTLVSRAYEARRKSIHSLHAKGWSMQRIADRWQITRERVRQILMIKD